MSFDELLDRIFPKKCQHQWEIFQTVNIYDVDVCGNKREVPYKFKYILRCTKCGDIKVVSVNTK